MHSVSSSDAPVFCSECGNVLLDPEDVEDMESDSSDEEEDELDAISGDEAGEEDDLDDLDDLDDEDEEDDLDDLESDSSTIDLEIDLDADLEGFEAVASSDEDEDDDDLGDDDDDLDDDLDDEEIEAEDVDDDDLEAEASVVEELEINLLKAVASQHEQLSPENLFVVNCGTVAGDSRWTAFYGDMPVAMASMSSANDNVKAIFNSPRFHEATTASVKQLGVMEGLASMGFKGIAPDVDLDVTVEQELLASNERKLEEVRTHFEAKSAEMHDRFGAALATAAAGINRNFFKGDSNPIAAQLIASISAAGFGNAEQLVTAAFQSHSDAYDRVVLARAMDIYNKSAEHQNELAEAIANANFTSQSSSATTTLGTTVQTTVAPAPAQQSLQSESAASDEINQRQRAAFKSLMR